MRFDFTTVDRSKVTFAPYNPTAEQMREQRDELLAATDKFMLPDFPINEDQLAQIISYRQALRELPSLPEWPNIEFPKKPF